MWMLEYFKRQNVDVRIFNKGVESLITVKSTTLGKILFNDVCVIEFDN